MRGLYAGILPEYYKVVPGVAIAFCTYELMKSMLGVQINATKRLPAPPPPPRLFMAGAAPGCISSNRPF